MLNETLVCKSLPSVHSVSRQGRGVTVSLGRRPRNHMTSEQALKARVNGLGDRNQARHRAGPRG